MYRTWPSARLRDVPKNRERGGSFLQDEPAMKKDRETKEDGRYIIFFSFDDEEEEKSPSGEDEG